MKTRLLIVIAIGMVGFMGIAFAIHDPNQSLEHSIILSPEIKEKSFEEFMEWCEPYYKEKCVDIYEKNKTSKLSIPLKLNDLASELWYDHDYIIDGTILDIRGYDQPERVYDIQINSFFKPEKDTSSKIITVYGSPNFYNSKGDSGIFFIKKDDARWTFGEYGAKATPECPPELMYHPPLEPQVYTRVPAHASDFDYTIDCYPHYYKKYLPQYLKTRGVTEFPSPLSQQIDRVSSNEVVCNEGLELILKNNGRAACVKPESIPKLVERNWIKSDEDGTTVEFSFCGVDGFDSEGNLNTDNSTHHWDENECTWEEKLSKIQLSEWEVNHKSFVSLIEKSDAIITGLVVGPEVLPNDHRNVWLGSYEWLKEGIYDDRQLFLEQSKTTSFEGLDVPFTRGEEVLLFLKNVDVKRGAYDIFSIDDVPVQKYPIELRDTVVSLITKDSNKMKSQDYSKDDSCLEKIFGNDSYWYCTTKKLSYVPVETLMENSSQYSPIHHN